MTALRQAAELSSYEHIVNTIRLQPICSTFFVPLPKPLFMRWTLTRTLQHSHYWLLEGTEMPAELRYNSEAHSIRLNSRDRRLYFLEKTGFLQNRFFLRTEYSVIVGESYHGKGNASIVLNDEKLFYRAGGNDLVLFKRGGEPVASCSIDGLQQMDPYELQALLSALFRNYQAAATEKNVSIALYA